MINLLHGDCLDLMGDIPDGSVDMVMADPPYGTTACKWDSVIPLEPMWKQLKRVIKKNGAIVLFGSEPFSSALRMSNIKNYKYDWVWEKTKAGNIALANKMPLKYHEVISVFYAQQTTYNKQMIPRAEIGKDRLRAGNKPIRLTGTAITNSKGFIRSYDVNRYDVDWKNPSSILKYKVVRGGKHPTQKPVALMEYLIKTYTNEGETVLDFCIGSGTTAVACEHLKRRWIGIEIEEKYCEISAKRIEKERSQLKLW